MYTQAYTLIKQRLAALPGVKVTEWYLQQYNTNDKSAMLKNTPGVYIEFLPSDTVQQGRGLQKTTARANIHLVTYNVHVNDKRVKKDDTLDHMALFDAVFGALNGKGGMLSGIAGNEALEGTEADCRLFNSLARVNITPPHDLKKQMVSIQEFEGVFYDHSNVKVYTPQNPDLEVAEE